LPFTLPPLPPKSLMVSVRPDDCVNLLQVEVMKRDGSASEISKPDTKMEEAQATAPRPQRPKGRRIKFYPGVSVRECLHINNYTDDELYQTWYHRNDFQRIKTSFQYIVQRVTNGTWEGDTETETARGLEYRNRYGATKRKANKLNGLMVVLDEQERQWSRGCDDDQAIADAFMAVNRTSTMRVIMLAAMDEAEVKELWKDDSDDLASVSSNLSKVSVDSIGSSKRKDAPEAEHVQKKTRLKAFMRKIQTAQRAGH
jgi:hypothetical protein